MHELQKPGKYRRFDNGIFRTKKILELKLKKKNTIDLTTAYLRVVETAETRSESSH